MVARAKKVRGVAKSAKRARTEKVSEPRAHAPALRADRGAIEHYADPDYYTATYARRLEDVAFYVRIAARYGGPILEYGAGNGRIAFALARKGHVVHGIDHSRAMVRDFEARREKEPDAIRRRLSISQGDMRTARVGKKYPLVLSTFNTALHLYTREDVEAFFASVRQHLAPGGRFIVDLSVPVAADLARDKNVAQGVPPFRYPGLGVVRYREIFDYDPITQVLDVTMSFYPMAKAKAGTPVTPPFSTNLTHRQFFPREWEALLHYNGFVVEAVHGDYQEGRLTRESDVMIWIARRAK